MRKFRTALDLTQGDIAAKLGVTPGAYSKIERGDTDPSVGRLQQLAAIFKVNITDFFTDQPAQNRVDDPELKELRNRLNALTKEVLQIKKGLAQRRPAKSKRKK